MEHITAVVGHLAWPTTVVIMGILFIKELKNGLVGKVMPDGGLIEAGGFRFQTNAAKQSAQNANVIVSEVVDFEPERGITPYDQVMDAWRELADAVTENAITHGGLDDRRKIYTNLDIIQANGVVDDEVLEGVRKLFQARNSARKLGADSIAEDDAAAFVGTAKALAKVFRG